MSQLLPEGVDGLADCPFTLHAAIMHALRILSYHDNVPAEDQPPRRIWLDGEKLAEHFKERDRERKHRYGQNPDEDEDGPHQENAVELISRG